MTDLVIASSEADASAAEAVKNHHAELAGALQVRTEAFLASAFRDDLASAESTRRDLVDWCRRELVPHAQAEEEVMYPAARATVEGRLLIEAMLDEHVVLVGLLREVADTVDVRRAAASAAALRALFNTHLTKENDLVLPLLMAAPDVSLAQILQGMHQLLGGDAETEGPEGATESGCNGHSCSCGEVDGPGFPELDVRAIPHAIRHATVFGALDAVPSGSGLELIAPHDPLPLLAQIEQRWPGVWSVSYRERGPESWKLTIIKDYA